MASKAMADMLATVRESYDYIITDLAPVMPAPNAGNRSPPRYDGLCHRVGPDDAQCVAESLASSEAIRRSFGAVLNRANPKMLKRIEAYKGSHYNSYYVEGA